MPLPIVALAVGAYKIYDSIRKNSKANRLAKENKRPVFNADGSIRQVYDTSLSELNSNYEKDFINQELQQNQAAGIEAILQSGGKADFETIKGQFGRGLTNGLSQIQMARDRKIANYNNAAYNLANSANSEFQYNRDAPYKDNKQLEAQFRQGSANSLNEGISDVVAGIADYGIANSKAGQYGKVGGDINTVGSSDTFRANPTTTGGGYNPSGNTIGTVGPSQGALISAGRVDGLVNPNQQFGGIETGKGQPYVDEYGELHYNY